jgi:heme/copper-type cytochrome/quinol oxidase subunit 3
MADAVAPQDLAIPAGGGRSAGWWGVLCLICTEAALFGYLLFSYAFFAVQNGPDWLPEKHPSLALAAPNTLILILSSVAVWWGERGARRGKRRQQIAGLALSAVLGAIFVTVQIFEWSGKGYGPAHSAYASLFFVVTGFHMAHVVVGVIILAVLILWSALGLFSPRRYAPISIGALYWHFVDVVWLAVFSAFYLSPYLAG